MGDQGFIRAFKIAQFYVKTEQTRRLARFEQTLENDKLCKMDFENNGIVVVDDDSVRSGFPLEKKSSKLSRSRIFWKKLSISIKDPF